LVVGQLRLAVDGGDRTAGDQCRGVVDRGAGVLRVAHHHPGTLHLTADFLQSCLDLTPEAAMEEQVLRRVPGEGELREYHQVSLVVAVRNVRRRDHARRVPLHVTYQEVELRERDTERLAARLRPCAL